MNRAATGRIVKHASVVRGSQQDRRVVVIDPDLVRFSVTMGRVKSRVPMHQVMVPPIVIAMMDVLRWNDWQRPDGERERSGEAAT